MSRGPDPRDRRDLAPRHLPALRRAVADLSWLLDRGYSDVAALKLVGDHLQLTRRQRTAVRRCSVGDRELAERAARRIDQPLAGERVAVDGLNQLILTERLLGGGAALRGRDGALRDLGSIHGTYRLVDQTAAAIDRLADALDGAAAVWWWLDAPVSNSGRVAGHLRRVAAARDLPWEVALLPSPDAALRTFDGWIATCDGPLLTTASGWIDLPSRIAVDLPDAWIVDLAGQLERPGGSGHQQRHHRS